MVTSKQIKFFFDCPTTVCRDFYNRSNEIDDTKMNMNNTGRKGKCPTQYLYDFCLATRW